MKFSIETKDLKDALDRVGKAIPARSSLPIMQTVLIQTGDGMVSLTGSDMDMTIETDARATIDAPGVMCLPYDVMRQFVGAAKAGLVTVEIDESGAVVSSGRNRVKLAATSATDYPRQSALAGNPVDIDPKAFCGAIRFCAASVEDSELRFTLAGVHLAEKDGDTHFWGTDGRGLHHAVITSSTIGGATIPVAGCAAIIAMIDGASDAQFAITDRGWHCVTGWVRAWGKVIDGAYPDMTKVYDQFPDWDMIAGDLAAADINDALSMATIGTDRDSQKARNVIVKVSDGVIAMRGHKGSGGVIAAGRAEIDCDTASTFGAILNADKIKRAVSGLSGKVSMTCCENRAIRFCPEDSDGMEAVIMTMSAMPGELADV